MVFIRHIERAERRGDRNEQQHSAADFRESDEDLVGRRRADGVPQHAHRREVAERLDEFASAFRSASAAESTFAIP